MSALVSVVPGLERIGERFCMGEFSGPAFLDWVAGTHPSFVGVNVKCAPTGAGIAPGEVAGRAFGRRVRACNTFSDWEAWKAAGFVWLRAPRWRGPAPLGAGGASSGAADG